MLCSSWDTDLVSVVICDYAATVLLLYEAPPRGQDNKQFCKLDLWRPELLAKHGGSGEINKFNK